MPIRTVVGPHNMPRVGVRSLPSIPSGVSNLPLLLLCYLKRSHHETPVEKTSDGSARERVTLLTMSC